MTYACCAQLNDMLDRAGATHYWGYGIETERPLPQSKGGMVVFHGGNEEAIGRGPAIAAILSAETARWDYVIFVNIGDEASVFPCHLLVHKNFRVWSQTVKPGTMNAVTADRLMIEGAPADCRTNLDTIGEIPRDLDYFFAGQITHPRRHACVKAMEAYRTPPVSQRGKSNVVGRAFNPDWYDTKSVIVKTTSFGAGLSHDSYYRFMRAARVIPCPAGPATPDSFRAAEALECGCVPLLDAYSPDRVPGYWDLVFGENHPFYIIEDWEKEFPFVMDNVLGNWEEEAERCAAFWTKYKKDFSQWLLKDMISLGAI